MASEKDKSSFIKQTRVKTQNGQHRVRENQHENLYPTPQISHLSGKWDLNHNINLAVKLSHSFLRYLTGYS